MAVNFVFLRSLDGQIFDETSKISIFYIYDTAPLTFCQISHHPMIVEGCTIAYSNHLIKTNRIVINSPFYDHWMARYLTKRQKSAFYIYDTAPFDVLSNILPFNDCRRTNLLSFDSS